MIPVHFPAGGVKAYRVKQNYNFEIANFLIVYLKKRQNDTGHVRSLVSFINHQRMKGLALRMKPIDIEDLILGKRFSFAAIPFYNRFFHNIEFKPFTKWDRFKSFFMRKYKKPEICIGEEQMMETFGDGLAASIIL